MPPAKLLVAALAATLVAPVLAQYKVIDANGRVTYTDRPPSAEGAKVVPMSRGGVTAEADSSAAALPYDLRQIVARYPVTLYTGPNCTPCEAGRQLLQQRGIPYSERLVLNEDDSDALERLSGGRVLPSLGVGSQALRGFGASDWSSYLDAAGYPRESRLPRTWQPAAASPLVARTSPAAQAPAPAAPAARAPRPAPDEGEGQPGPASTIRF
ncbi:MAG: glutaredoxin family protein [Burkholderiales bacterium]|nr:glutaredoxin family protein [Burkholderiales bacterium]